MEEELMRYYKDDVLCICENKKGEKIVCILVDRLGYDLEVNITGLDFKTAVTKINQEIFNNLLRLI
jgi:hypothetical protein